MATTTLMPLDPALNPQRVNRVLTISADLLPEEVVIGRRSRQSRTWVGAVVLLAVVLLGLWYVRAQHDVRANEAGLSAATKVATDLQKNQAAHQRVVTVQNQTAAITRQLAQLMGADLPWATLLDRLRSTGASSGVTVDAITASLVQENATSATQTLPSASEAKAIGSVTIGGTAPDKPTVARYVKNLGTVDGIANPYLTTAAKAAGGTWSYSITVDITSANQCGRFTTKCTSGGN
jgi:type IV pilus assembly protein PilN